MNKIAFGGGGRAQLVGVGLFWMQGRAEVEQGAPPPAPAPIASPARDALPTADIPGLTGLEPPEATELTREQRRFFRYDRVFRYDRARDLKVTRNELLSSRSDGFRKLGVDGNNLLTFEEWAVTKAERFDGADGDRNGELSAAEFATTAPKRKPAAKARCDCYAGTASASASQAPKSALARPVYACLRCFFFTSGRGGKRPKLTFIG